MVHFVSGLAPWLWVLSSFVFIGFSSAVTPESRSSSPVTLKRDDAKRQIIVDNGIVRVVFDSPGGDVLGIGYNGIENVLETVNVPPRNRGYWDVFWKVPGGADVIDTLQGTSFQVVREDDDQVEVSFSRKWDSSKTSLVPLNVEKRFVLRRGVPGFYSYAIMERMSGWPDVDMPQIRIVFKLKQNLFHYMAISDTRQRIMPSAQDRHTGQPLAYPEAVLLTKPENPALRGEVDDKYQYSSENEESKVHGWISSKPAVGFWMITPSNEFRGGGPTKQDLTSHAGPIILEMFTSTHYAGMDMRVQYRNGEPWKKVFGPAFVYLNSASVYDPRTLWNNAKSQLTIEERNWPYSFVTSPDFPTSDQRGSVSGQLLVSDRYISQKPTYASNSYVGLAPPGDAGSWQTEDKGYQFWIKTSTTGTFEINNIREGTYNLYAWVAGILGDYKLDTIITVKRGSRTNLGTLTFIPPRNGPTLWEIGFPDRSAAEFNVPDPYPTLINRLYINSPNDKFRQYGLWDRYADLYQQSDLKYTVGSSSAKNWFYAQVTRAAGNGKYRPTTWQINFKLAGVDSSGNYTLQLALASATVAKLEIRFNNGSSSSPLFSTGLVGRDNAIARHGIHGLYRLYTIGVPSTQLVDGMNTIYLAQTRSDTPFNGVMYDYIRFEGPGRS